MKNFTDVNEYIEKESAKGQIDWGPKPRGTLTGSPQKPVPSLSIEGLLVLKQNS